MQKQLTDAAVLLRLAYQGMRKLKLPTDKILAEAGVAIGQLNTNERTPMSAQVAFWSACEKFSQDSDIGLHLGENLPLYRGQVLEYLFTSSPHFGDGLTRALAYQRLVSDALDASLIQDDIGCYLENNFDMSLTDTTTLRHFTECLLVGVVRFFRFLTEGQFKPLHIDLTYKQGANADEYRRIFDCDVTLEQEKIRLYFDAQVLKYPMWQAEPELLRLHEQLAIEKLQALARVDLVDEVRRAIGAGLETGEVSLESVAHQLNMPVRRLRAHLTEANTSFVQVLAKYRCRLAKRLLSQTDESIERIVYLTGFSEPSTFYRAFKRWTGETPINYRTRKQEQNRLSH